MLGELLNGMIINQWEYKIDIKKYHWCKHDDDYNNIPEFDGIHIWVPINDLFKVSIIQAFNEATGEFYGYDIWEIGLLHRYSTDGYDCRDWRLIPVYEWDDTVHLCEHDEVIEWIKIFKEKYGES